jgi:type II secretory pathway component GspD/PulD (secretin)
MARQLGVDFAVVGDAFWLGASRPEDSVVIVRHIGRFNPAEIQAAARVGLSVEGKIFASPDGLLVVGDKAPFIRRLTSMLAELETAPFGTWVVQLFVIELSRTDLRDIGLAIQPTLSGSVGVRGDIATGVQPFGSVDVGLAATLRTVANSSRSKFLVQPLVLVRDGSTTIVGRGEVIPIPQRSVSDQGTVNTVGFTERRVGTQFDVGVRSANDNGYGILNLKAEISDISGFIGDLPRINELRLSGETIVQSGGVYLLGSLERDSDQTSGEFGVVGNPRTDATNTVVQIWARLYRVVSGREASAPSGKGRSAEPIQPVIEENYPRDVDKENSSG